MAEEGSLDDAWLRKHLSKLLQEDKDRSKLTVNLILERLEALGKYDLEELKENKVQIKSTLAAVLQGDEEEEEEVEVKKKSGIKRQRPSLEEKKAPGGSKGSPSVKRAKKNESDSGYESDSEEEADEAKTKTRKKSSTASSSSKKGKGKTSDDFIVEDEDEEEDNSGYESDSESEAEFEDDDEGSASQKRRKVSAEKEKHKKKESKPQPKKPKSTSSSSSGSTATDSALEELQQMATLLRKCGAGVPRIQKDKPKESKKKLKEAMEKYGLFLGMSQTQIKKAKDRIEREKELADLDTSNIISESRTLRRRAPVKYNTKVKLPEVDSEEDSLDSSEEDFDEEFSGGDDE